MVDRRRGPWINPGCCRDAQTHADHLRRAIAEASAAVRLIPLRGDQDGFTHKMSALLALADLRRLVALWGADGGTKGGGSSRGSNGDSAPPATDTTAV
jgi:hypothetical protein